MYRITLYDAQKTHYIICRISLKLTTKTISLNICPMEQVSNNWSFNCPILPSIPSNFLLGASDRKTWTVFVIFNKLWPFIENIWNGVKYMIMIETQRTYNIGWLYALTKSWHVALLSQMILKQNFIPFLYYGASIAQALFLPKAKSKCVNKFLNYKNIDQNIKNAIPSRVFI